MFAYQYNFVYYKKSEIEDNTSYKATYRQLQKLSRKITIFFIMFTIVSACLLYEIKETFLTTLFKGAILAAIVIPSMNSYYSDKNRFKFSL